MLEKKKFGNCLYTDFIKNNRNYNRVNEYININKNALLENNSKEKDSNDQKNIFLDKINKEDKEDLLSKIRKHNISLEKEEKCEFIRVIKNIRQHDDNAKRSRKKSVLNSNIAPTLESKEHLNNLKNLTKFKSKNDITKINFERENNKVKMLKDFNVTD